MKVENIIEHIKRLHLDFEIGERLTEEDFIKIEHNLKVTFPIQVKSIYQYCNGLKVRTPKLEILALDKLVNNSGIIVFSIFNSQYSIGFNTNEINEANQWNIINVDSYYVVTLTIASFWSNKIWAWLRNEREIWQKEIFN